MNKLAFSALCFSLAAQSAFATGSAPCPAGVDPTASTPLAGTTSNGTCALKTSRGYPLPDAACTPGAINPSVDLAILQGGKFKTGCDRDKATSSKLKRSTYTTYKIKKPATNTGAKQTCELDHLISLELGGADTLDNIWPQCGPARVKLAKRYFKIKDAVENYLAVKVKAGEIPLADAQHGIAKDWTQFVDQSVAYWSTHSAKGFGRDQ
jgi:hypothetical protein